MADTRRPTKQRLAVADALAGSSEFVTAQDLHARLRAAGHGVGLATVYRNLSALVEEGQVDLLRAEDGEARYRLCATEDHHHHLVCDGCGRTVEIEAPTVEHWAQQVAREHGFVDVTHTLEIFGRCSACAAAGTADGEGD